MNTYKEIVGKFSYWSALVLMFSLFAPMYFTRIAVVVWAIFWILEFRWLDRKNILIDKTLLCVGGFLFFYFVELLSSLWTIEPKETSALLSRQVYLLAVTPVLVFGVNDYYKPKNMLYALMIGGVFFSAIYYVALFCSASYNIMYGNEVTAWQKVPLWQYGNRLIVFKHHAYFGLMLLVACIGACFVRKNTEKVEGKWASYFLISLFCLLTLASVFVSGSRASLLAIPVVIFVFLAWKFRRKIWIITISGILLVGTSGFVILKHHYRSSNSAEVYQKAIEPGSDPRILIWKATKDIAPDYFWFGSGAGTSKVRLTRYYAQEHYPITFLNRRYDTHNQYLSVLLDLGIFVAIGFAACFVLIFIYHEKRTGLFALLTTSVFGFQLLFDNLLNGTEGLVMFCVLIMLINWMHRCDKRGIEW